jgi:type II secretory pathway component PulK
MNYRSRSRRGAALLVCTLAAAVLSMAAIAILRSSKRAIERVDAVQVSSASRAVSEGLLQRSIAILRVNPNATGSVTDPNNGMSSARAELRQLSPTATQVQVFLYPGSTVPAEDIVVDPTAL